MTRFSTLYDKAFQLNISNLKKQGYLSPNKKTLLMLRNGQVLVLVVGSSSKKSSHVQLIYTYKGVKYDYKIPIVTALSNLGKGEIHYFYCPTAQKRCRKLYFMKGRFGHREAFSKCSYSIQVKSKKQREGQQILNKLDQKENAIIKMNSKYFKKFYDGNPTQHYLQLVRKIKNAEGISFEDYFQTWL